MSSPRLKSPPAGDILESIANLQALPGNRQYLLYCDRGTMSRMHAGHLKAEGHGNIKVYAPAV